MAIVLAVIGLIVGTVVAGGSMIRSSQLQSVIKEATQYEDAIAKFEAKYRDYPGDMGDATNYWGASTADGNGNQIIEGAAAANTTGEMFQFWNQLALASFLPGKFTGIAGPASAIDTVPGTNAPKSRVSGAGWSVYNLLNFAGDNNNYALNYGNVLACGATSPGTITIGGILKPDEAASLDTKIDDGKPATGKVIAVEDGGFSSSASAKCTTSASATDYSGGYNISGKAQKACAFYFILRELNLQGSANGNAGGPTVAIHGVCDNTGPLACAPGTPTGDNGQSTCGTTRTWTCAGAHGGTNSGMCSFTYRACAVNGVCNNAVALGCSAGTATADNGQTACSTTRTWTCAGLNGGINATNCSIANAACPATNGVCGGSANTCASGTPSGYNAGACGGSATWTCNGQYGGGNAPCSKANAACAPPAPECDYNIYSTSAGCSSAPIADGSASCQAFEDACNESVTNSMNGQTCSFDFPDPSSIDCGPGGYKYWASTYRCGCN